MWRPFSHVDIIHERSKLNLVDFLLCNLFLFESFINDSSLYFSLGICPWFVYLVDKTSIFFSSQKVLHLFLIIEFVLLYFSQIIFKDFDDSRIFVHSSSLWVSNHRSVWRLLCAPHVFIKGIILLWKSGLIIISCKIINVLVVHWVVKFSDLFEDFFLLFKMRLLFLLFKVILYFDVKRVDTLNSFWSLLAFSNFLFSFFRFSSLFFKSFLYLFFPSFFFFLVNYICFLLEILLMLFHSFNTF